MLKTVESVMQGNQYYPVVTETIGAGMMAVGILGVGSGTCFKVEEFYMGHPQSLPNVAPSGADFCIEAGRVLFLKGLKLALPGMVVAASVYFLLSQAEIL